MAFGLKIRLRLLSSTKSNKDGLEIIFIVSFGEKQKLIQTHDINIHSINSFIYKNIVQKESGGETQIKENEKI